MKPGPAQRRCVTDIVQPRRCDQTVRCLGIETPTQPLGSRRDAPDMRQPPRLLSQPRLGLAPCTLRQNPAHSRQLTSHSTMTQPLAAYDVDPGGQDLRGTAATCRLRYARSAPVRWRSRPRRSCASPSVRRHAHMHPRPAPELSRRPPQLWHHDEAQLPSLLAASRRRERQAGPTAA